MNAPFCYESGYSERHCNIQDKSRDETEVRQTEKSEKQHETRPAKKAQTENDCSAAGEGFTSKGNSGEEVPEEGPSKRFHGRRGRSRPSGHCRATVLPRRRSRRRPGSGARRSGHPGCP